MAVACPTCGLVLQTLDLPCPACGQIPLEIDVDSWTLHEYSKTFHNRRRYIPEPDALIAELNYWLATQPGLVGVAPIVHRDRHGAVKGVTLTCTASSKAAQGVFQFHRLQLSRSLGAPRIDFGSALNQWHDNYPALTRVQHWVFTREDGSIESWVLSFGPPWAVPIGEDPGSAPPLRLPRTVRIPATLLLWLVVLVCAGAQLQNSIGTLGSWLSVLVATVVAATVWVLVERRAVSLGSKPKGRKDPTPLSDRPAA
jgi:hypothetical protein